MATATAAQTLFSVTQAGTGVTTFSTVVGSATLSEEVVATFTQDYTSTAVFTEVLTGGLTQLTTHTVQISETLDYVSLASVHDVFQASSSIPSTETTTLLTTREAYLRNTVYTEVAVPINQVFTADDVVVFTIDSTTVHPFYASNTISHSVTYTYTVEEHFVAQNSTLAGFTAETYTEIFRATNESQAVTEAHGSVSSTALVSDVHSNVRSTFEELLDTFTGTEFITFDGSIANNEVTDTFIARDSVWSKDFGALAWVLNPETAGLSYYDNFGFDSIVEFNGVLYATSPEGIFALNATTDEGRFIEAELQTGFIDFGTDQNKRVSDIYVGYTADGYLETDVETYDGPQEVYTYSMEERTADAPRNNRIKVGKGLNSRFWRFTIRNLDGADFQVYDFNLNVGVSNRRL